MSLLRAAARPRRARLPPRERLPALNIVPPASPNPVVDPHDGEQVADLVDLLTIGDMTVLGQIADASNGCLLVDVTDPGDADRHIRAIYKPTRGERPLWDFPTASLGQREVAAFVISDHAGYGVVPPTVWRDGPWGTGSVQLWVDHDDERDGVVDVVAPEAMRDDQVAVLAAETDDGRQVLVVHDEDPWTVGLAVFDAVVNNADRKGSHILTDPAGRHFGIDHGVCLHADPKLRTILWGWAGDPLPAAEVERLRLLDADLADEDGPLVARLAPLLTAGELTALHERVNQLLESGEFPHPPDTGYPAIPWPPL